MTIREGTEVAALNTDGTLHLTDGTVLSPGATIIAAGIGSFGLLAPDDPTRIGRGVKGQGALLSPTQPVDPAAPILYNGGTYVIAHENGLVAVGSTSEDVFDAHETTDTKLDDLINKARALCPALEGARIVERWAGVRPRANGREPLVGPLPGRSRTILATGGFKISFAIAHLMAEAAISFALGEQVSDLPGIFLPEQRFGDMGL